MGVVVEKVRTGECELSVRRAGHGGVPLLLLHGFPATGEIFSRNIDGLTEAGFDVAAPDLRGYGASDLAPDGFYDVAAHSADLKALCDAYGWHRVIVAGFGPGARVAIDMAARHPDHVDRLVLLDHEPPDLPDAYAEAGLPPRPEEDHVREQGGRTEALLDELDDPDARRAYVAGFYRERGWGDPAAFTDEDLAVLVEPFGERDRLAAAFAADQVSVGTRAASAPALTDRRLDQPVLVLAGPADAAVDEAFVRRCEIAYPQVVGPFLVPGAGRFLPWERPTVFTRAVTYFAADLLD